MSGLAPTSLRFSPQSPLAEPLNRGSSLESPKKTFPFPVLQASSFGKLTRTVSCDEEVKAKEEDAPRKSVSGNVHVLGLAALNMTPSEVPVEDEVNVDAVLARLYAGNRTLNRSMKNSFPSESVPDVSSQQQEPIPFVEDALNTRSRLWRQFPENDDEVVADKLKSYGSNAADEATALLAEDEKSSDVLFKKRIFANNPDYLKTILFERRTDLIKKTLFADQRVEYKTLASGTSDLVDDVVKLFAQYADNDEWFIYESKRLQLCADIFTVKAQIVTCQEEKNRSRLQQDLLQMLAKAADDIMMKIQTAPVGYTAADMSMEFSKTLHRSARFHDLPSARLQILKDGIFKGKQFKIRRQIYETVDVVLQVANFVDAVTTYKNSSFFHKKLKWAIMGMNLGKDLEAVDDNIDVDLVKALKAMHKEAEKELENSWSLCYVIDDARRLEYDAEKKKEIIKEQWFVNEVLIYEGRDLVDDFAGLLVRYVEGDDDSDNVLAINWEKEIRVIHANLQRVVSISPLQKFLVKTLGDALNVLTNDASK